MEKFLDYEFQVCEFHREENDETVWHWKHIPEEQLFAAGFITDYNRVRLMRRERMENGENIVREYGFDGISQDKEGNYHGIQAKCWNPKMYLNAHDLGTFFCALFTRLVVKNPKSIGYLYHTCRLQTEVKESFIHTPNLCNVHLPYINTNEEPENTIEETKLELYQPQKEAIKELKKDWSGVGLISMPCALGKTVLLGNYLSYCNPKHTIILSPLRVLTKQMLERIHPFLKKKKPLLVDSDEGGTTDELEVLEIMKNNDCLISITYDSFKNIFLTNYIENCLIVVDEAHNLLSNMEIMDYLNEYVEKTLLLTATPSKTMMEYMDCKIIYDYPMSEAIANKYVCDYLVNIPVLNLQEDKVDINVPTELGHLDYDLTIKSLFLISGMLETGCRKCIVYCGNIEECIAFNEIFMEIVSEYHGIDCWVDSITAQTTFGRREKILRKFQDNESRLSILSSVRILNEGINIVKCDSVFITKVNENEIVAVQRMCRANRLDKTNPMKKAQCFIWADDLNKTVGMLQFLRQNDETGFFNKIVSRNGNYDDKGEQEEIDKVQNYTKTIREYIEVKSVSFEERWKMRMQEVSDYIDKYGKRPTKEDKDKNVRQLGIWIMNQLIKYSENKQIMRKEEFRNLWEQFTEKYSEYFTGNDEKWKETFSEVVEYINKNNCRPSKHSQDNHIKSLGYWVDSQLKNYRLEQKIMKNSQIKKIWENFMKKYAKYFLTGNDQWNETLEQVEKFIKDNGKKPSTKDADKDTRKLGNWISTQQKNYAKKVYVMEDEGMRQVWENFMEKYPSLFFDKDMEWKSMLRKCKSYIDTNGKRPLQKDEDEEVRRLGNWMSNQKRNYDKNAEMMKKTEMRQLWQQFEQSYSAYFR